MEKQAIKTCIQSFIDGGRALPEHEIIQHVKEHDLFDFASDDPLLGLYHKHFSVMHCLYLLQADYAEKGWYLEIGPLKIQLHKDQGAISASQALALSNPLVKSFYLDWQNLESVDADGVGDLMASFWKRFATGGEPVQEALVLMELGQDASWKEIQLSYRKKAAKLHPDKGGSAAAFAALQQAFETLKIHFGK